MGQEWEAVYVINVSDGNFPNEFAAGKPEQIEEERRLLYVAMTRKVLACFDQLSWSDERLKDSPAAKAAPVDVAAKLRGMWA